MSNPRDLRTRAMQILEAGLAAVDPAEAVRGHLHVDGEELVLGRDPERGTRLELARFRRVLVVGAGKASARMAAAVEEVLGERVEAGVVVVKYDHTVPTRAVELVEASHPVPDVSGMRGARRVLGLVEEAGEDTLVVAVISGGGSALLPLPAEGISLAEKQQLTSQLLAAGASIHEINTVRKHISALKGGQLARAVHPATLVSLLLSDVVGDDLEVIASGPTVADPSTFQEALAVLKRHQIWEHAPAGVRRRMKAGNFGSVPETPKAGDPALATSHTLLVGTNRLALEACRARAEELGYATRVLASTVQGEAREVARVLAAIAREVRETGQPLAPPACLIAGGETTVTLRGEGKGGRNQELAAAAARDLDGLEATLLLSAGTDGTDGPTEAAGGVVDGETMRWARDLGHSLDDALAESDTGSWLEALDALVVTGPTGTNVMDVQLILVDEVD